MFIICWFWEYWTIVAIVIFEVTSVSRDGRTCRKIWTSFQVICDNGMVRLQEQKNFVTQSWRDIVKMLFLQSINATAFFLYEVALFIIVIKRLLYVNRNQVFLQMHWIGIGTFFIVLVRYCWHAENLHSTYYLELIMHKCGTKRIDWKARKIKALKMLISFVCGTDLYIKTCQSHQGVKNPMHNSARSTWQLLLSVKRQTRKGTKKVIECYANRCDP